MIRLAADCTRRGSVTRVRVTVQNDRNTAQRVELESTLDGPVWAPRSGPLAVPEWSETTWEGIIPAARTRGIGFATSAAPSDDPVEIVSVERATHDATGVGSVLAELDRSSPPSKIIDSEP